MPERNRKKKKKNALGATWMWIQIQAVENK